MGEFSRPEREKQGFLIDDCRWLGHKFSILSAFPSSAARTETQVVGNKNGIFENFFISFFCIDLHLKGLPTIL